MTNRVLAVVVTYNPKPEALAVLLKSTLKQLDAIAIVDNASNNFAEIETIVNQMNLVTRGSIQLHQQTQNLGLGCAHNVGINIARSELYSYVLLLDQDSVPMTGMAANLLQAHQIKSMHESVSATGVTYLNADNGSESFFVRFGLLKFRRQYCADRDEDGCVEADFLISSGSLISLQALNDIGDMDESLFIDHVDTEWFLRAKNKGFKCFGVCDAVMQHGLGETTHQISIGANFFLRRLFGLKNARQRNVPQHHPFRYYYIFRNSVLLYGREYTSYKWRWNDLQRLFMIATMFGLIKSPRRKNIRMMVRGIKDGVRGITGKLTES